MMMTPQEAAAAMDGNEYGSEGSPELFAKMKENNLICLFGYSDDIIEIRGAENDEVGAGSTMYFGTKGLLTNRCEDEDCPYYAETVKHASKVETKDGGDEFGLWDYETDIPFARFLIMEDGEVYGSGIVFSLDDVQW